MTTETHTTGPLVLDVRGVSKPLRWAQLALAVGAASSVVEASTLVFTKAGGSGNFKYTADYWLTAAGVAQALASLVLVLAVGRLQHGRDGRFGRYGLVINSIACLLLAAQMSDGLATASEVQWGPIYPLATLAAFVGLSLLAAGSWRVGLLPRWTLALWPIIWVIGSMAAQGPTPLLLLGFYVTIAVFLSRRASTPA